jgi:hypothetical protein
MASLPDGSACSLWESERGITSITAHAAPLRSRPVRVVGTVVCTVALAGATLHPVAAQAPHLLAAGPCAIATSPMDFAPINAEQCFTVPAGVRQIEAGLVGGFGGTGYNPGAANSPLGGDGATVVAVVDVTPGQVLYVEVAGSGYPGGSPDAVLNAGYGGGNGGGNGGTSRLATGQPRAGGGGGATDLRTEPNAGCGTSAVVIASLASRILVAGGGGGGGETNDNSAGDGGGRGGLANVVPQAGTDGTSETGLDGRGGSAATATAGGGGGGAGSVGGTAGTTGTPGCGGAGGDGTGGGGGGGGYFGGGGGGGGAEGSGGSGAGGGGGGGSNYANPLMTCDATSGVQELASSRTGPRAVIVFPVPTPCPTLTFEPDVSSGGFAVTAVGTGWSPQVPITLSWGEFGSLPSTIPLGTITPSTATFTFTIVLMTRDEVGERALVAKQFPSGLGNVAFLLVVLAPEEPPTFVFRR